MISDVGVRSYNRKTRGICTQVQKMGEPATCSLTSLVTVRFTTLHTTCSLYRHQSVKIAKLLRLQTHYRLYLRVHWHFIDIK